MSILKRATSVAMVLTLAAGLNVMPVLAAETAPENGDYTATIHFHNASNPANYSMCDPIFAHTADVTLTDENAELTFYVAYPIPAPAFSTQGADGTIKDVKMTVNKTEYGGKLDITTKEKKTFDTDSVGFGIKAGDELPTEAVTVSLPRAAVDSFDDGIDTSAYVNVVMNSTQNFKVKLTELTKVTAPTKTTEQTATVTADVAAPTAAYSVTIPQSVAMGTLSAEKDTTQAFTVEVTATNLGTEK